MTLNTMSNLKQRLIVSTLVILLISSAIYLSHLPYIRPIFVGLVALIVGLALREYYHLACNKGYAPLVKEGIGTSTLYLIAVYLAAEYPGTQSLPWLVLGVFSALFFIHYFFRGTNPLANLAVTIFGLLYLTIPLGCIIGINYFYHGDPAQDGRWWLFYLIAVTKMTDTGAFFVGKNFGKIKFVTHLSPKKTLEGAIGGMAAAVLTSVLIALAASLLSQPTLILSLGKSIWLGILISFLAQVGDLAESLLKRDAGVKDSSHLPGLGGILDIVDSMIFTTPLIYYMMVIQ